MDPPRHTKIRRLMAAAFTPKQLARIDDHIVANARRIVDDIADKGEVDFVSEVAALVPMHNICDMVGIPRSTAGPSPTSPNSPTVGAIPGS